MVESWGDKVCMLFMSKNVIYDVCVYICVYVCLYLQNLNNIYKENMIYFNSYDTSFNCVKLISEAKLKISRKILIM